MTALVVTADDYGLTDGTCRAILSAHHDGIVTATSVLAVVERLEERLGWLDDAPNLAVGVHLTLVGEDPPLLGAREIPTLVDRRGRFARSWRELVVRLAAGRVDPTDVRRELVAQFDRVAARQPVSHLDSHQHVHLWPSVAAVVVELAAGRKVPYVRVPRPASGTPRHRGVWLLADALAKRADRAGLVTVERFRGIEEAGRWDLGSMRGAIAEVAAARAPCELNCHPGLAIDADRRRYRWGYGWGRELDALTSPALASDVARLGVRLVRPGER